MFEIKIDEERLGKVADFFSRIEPTRPKPDRNLDQFRAKEISLLKRATLLGNLANINSKRLLFLGDNDLTSVVFSMFYKASNVTVVDIDQRLLKFMEEISSSEGFPIKLFHHDLRNPLKKADFRDFDVVFFDPPYTPQAINLWLVRAMEASLGSGRNRKRKKVERLSSVKYYLNYGYTDRSTERGLKIQQIVTSLGLIIQDKFRGFNEYYGAESLGSKSDLYILQPTPLVNIRELDSVRSQFYTGKKQS